MCVFGGGLWNSLPSCMKTPYRNLSPVLQVGMDQNALVGTAYHVNCPNIMSNIWYISKGQMLIWGTLQKSVWSIYSSLWFLGLNLNYFHLLITVIINYVCQRFPVYLDKLSLQTCAWNMFLFQDVLGDFDNLNMSLNYSAPDSVDHVLHCLKRNWKTLTLLVYITY